MTAKSYRMRIDLFLAFAFVICCGATVAHAYVPGDADSSGQVDIDDAVFLVEYVLAGGSAPDPIEAGDADCSGGIDIDDVVYLIGYIFSGGPAPCSETEPSGNLTGMSSCKVLYRTPVSDDSLWYRDCIEYHYDGEGTLTLRHINAGFNCCPEIAAAISIESGVITIEDIELSGDCDCLCLFDLDYEIVNIEPGQYFLMVIEPYVNELDDPLEFDVDLSSATDGVFCVYRYHYPWGFPQ